MGTGFEPVYTALQAAASPLGQPTVVPMPIKIDTRADNGVRTRDLNLGKVALYQLSYVRTATIPRDQGFTLADAASNHQSATAPGASPGTVVAWTRTLPSGP